MDEFRLTKKGEEVLNLYLEKLKEYYKNLKDDVIKEHDNIASILEVVINTKEIDEVGKD